MFLMRLCLSVSVSCIFSESICVYLYLCIDIFMHAHLPECVNMHKYLPLNASTSLSLLRLSIPLSLYPTFLYFPFFLPATLHYASESNYPIYMQNDASDAFVTVVPGGAEMGDKDGQESTADR